MVRANVCSMTREVWKNLNDCLGYKEYQLFLTEMTSRFQISFPHDASRAFGKHHKVQNNRDFPTNAEAAFRSVRHDGASKAQEKPLFESKHPNPAFTDEALSAFGKKHSATGNDIDQAFQSKNAYDNFSQDALSAFGKKSNRKADRDADNDAGPAPKFVDPKSLVHLVMNMLPEDDGSEWTKSAFRKHTSKPLVQVEEKEQFPALGSKKMEDEFPALSSGKSKAKDSPTMSFANLVKKRAEQDAKEAEEFARIEKKRLEAEKKRLDELDRIKKARKMYSGNSFHVVRRDMVDEDDDVQEEVEDAENGDDADDVAEDTNSVQDDADDYE